MNPPLSQDEVNKLIPGDCRKTIEDAQRDTRAELVRRFMQRDDNDAHAAVTLFEIIAAYSDRYINYKFRQIGLTEFARAKAESFRDLGIRNISEHAGTELLRMGETIADKKVSCYMGPAI